MPIEYYSCIYICPSISTTSVHTSAIPSLGRCSGSKFSALRGLPTKGRGSWAPSPTRPSVD